MWEYNSDECLYTNKMFIIFFFCFRNFNKFPSTLKFVIKAANLLISFNKKIWLNKKGWDTGYLCLSKSFPLKYVFVRCQRTFTTMLTIKIFSFEGRKKCYPRRHRFWDNDNLQLLFIIYFLWNDWKVWYILRHYIFVIITLTYYSPSNRNNFF